MSASKHILSKSTFLYGCQCPKRLFLNKFRPDLRNPEEEEEQSLFASGLDVGLLARELFPGGISAAPPDTFSYSYSEELTEQYIKQGTSIIYEACFNYQDVLCAIDILVKENEKWYAYEVKGSTKVKEEHILDAAFQYHVITKAGLPMEDIFIVHLNNQYVRRGELEVQKLFTKKSVLHAVKEQEPFVNNKIGELKQIIEDKVEPTIAVGEQCLKPHNCDFSIYCNSNKDESKFKSTREAFINKEYLNKFFSEFEYPLFYFDFETLMPPIPQFSESRPYQQIPFQYSLHIQQSKDAELSHSSFLGDGNSDPREPLIKELLNALGTEGSIIVWNQAFEISRLKEIARDFPQYLIEINEVIERIVDLMVPFRKKQYYHPDFNESYSIKNILPALVPELGYEELVIQDGMAASSTYAELKNQTNEIQMQQREQLLEYCKLDTLAMVKILQRIMVDICD